MRNLRLDFIQSRWDRVSGRCLFLSLCLLCLLLLCIPAWGRIRIDIYGPELVKYPIVIAPFTFSNGASQDMANQVEYIFTNDLKLSGFFKVSGSEAFPPGAMDALKNPGAVDLSSWAGKPYEALVSGGVALSGGKLEVFFRLFDLVEKTFITGLRYSAPLEDVRHITHRMSDEIIFHLTGQIGVSQTKIGFVSNGGGVKEICAIDFDGQGFTRLTNHDSICISPAWSPDGKHIAYTCFRRRNPDLYMYDISKRKFRILSSREGVNSAPSWSPDGTKIALMLRKGDRTKIAIIDAIKGGEPVFITSGGGNETSPAWSPDGQRLAFLSDRSGNPQIYIISVNGSNLMRITFEGNYNASPAWSPLGDRIAFCSMVNGHFDIVTCTPEGKDLQRLTQNAGNNEDPSWSPDGRFIAFSSDRTGRFHIYCMNANGANLRQITFMMDQETEPGWSPYMF